MGHKAPQAPNPTATSAAQFKSGAPSLYYSQTQYPKPKKEDWDELDTAVAVGFGAMLFGD